MPDEAEQLRARAARLLALALQARDDGNIEHAESLTAMAGQCLDYGLD
jgi:hypothetical protein